MTISPALRKNVAVVAFLTLLLSLLTFTSQPAFAAPAGTLTINDAGGGSLPTPSGGVYDIQSNIIVAPADIEAALASGAVTLWATSITVESDIDVPNSNALTLKATGDIQVNGAVDITSQAGEIVFWSDSDATGGGAIRLGSRYDTTRGTISTNGGNLSFGGGASFATGYATSSSVLVTGKPAFGVGIWGFHIDAGGGDISMRGAAGANVAGGIRAVLIEPTDSSLGAQVVTSGSGNISVLGDASTLTGAISNTIWGATVIAELSTATGDITVAGHAGGTTGGNLRGLVLVNANLSSTSGDFYLEDRTTTSPNTGSYFAGTNSFATSGSINLETDKFTNDSGSFTVSTGPFSLTPYVDSNFDAASTLGNFTAISASSVTIGASGNTSDITVNRTLNVGGPLTIHGATLTFSGAVTATTVNLYSSSAVTQTAALTASNLALNGSSSFTLTNTSNQIGTLAAGSSGTKVSSLTIFDSSGGLTIGQVGALEGIAATGDVLVETGSGDIALTKNIATDSTASSAITLNAGDSTAAGTATGGNIVVSGSPTLTTGTGGIVSLFSGDDSGSTGLTTLAGGPSNTYYGVDETSSLSPALSAGTAYALYRGKETPQLSSLSNRSVTVGAASVTLTDPTATNRSSASVGGTVAWTTSNSSVASLSGSTLSYGSVGTATITATFTPTDTATYQSVATTFTVTVSAASSGGSSSSSSSSTVATPVAPVAPTVATQTPRPLQATINTNPVPRPVERLGLVFDPDAPSRATVGGAIANLVKTPVGPKDLSIAAGAFQFGVSLADADGAEVQTDTPSQSPELFVPRGRSAAVSGKGSYPGSFVQLFLPGNGNDSRELARIPVRSDGTFASDLSFQAGALELPVPIGRQVLQVVGYDELGNQTVVDMTVNIGQGVPAPEPNRQAGALPALTAGQSLATSGGIPETVSVTSVPEAGNVVVEGSGWVINVNADRDNGVVETTDGNVLVRLNPSSVGTTSGSGFLPGTLATVWLFSEPTLVATVSVDDAGEFSAEFLVDQRLIAPGEHTLQVQGVGSDGYIKAANLGVLVEEPVELTTESASTMLWWVVGVFLLALVLLLFVLARRRRREA